MLQGWIKLHRNMLNNPIVMKDSDHLAVWTYLLMKVTHKDYDIIYSGKRMTLTPGQQVFSRKSIADDLKISESKVQRILKLFESEQQIEQRTNRQSRVITIVHWSEYQESEQQIEQGLNNERTTSEQRVNTNKNIKNIENNKNINNINIAEQIPYKDIIDFLNEKTGKSYRSTTSKTKDLIKARYNEGFKLDDFKKVINNKALDWTGTEYEQYLRPTTLFGTKFEGYLNETPKREGQGFEVPKFSIEDIGVDFGL